MAFLLALPAATVFAGELRVPNRPAAPDEWGYRPADGSTNRLNPPSFTWPHESEARSYAIQWGRTADFAEPQTAAGFVWNTYTHAKPLASGRWFWRYQFVNRSGATSTWSQVRSVVVPPEAVEFPMPSRAEQRERVPTAHPRLFLRPEDLPRLRELAGGREARSFQKLRAEADRIIAAGPTPEPTHRGSATNKDDKDAVKWWWPNREQTQRACQEAEVIAFVSLITGEAKYAEAARRWVLQLAAWDPDGPTNFRLNCEAGKVMLYRPARAYDWAWAVLSESERETVRRVMVRRCTDAWNSGEVGRGTGHLTRPYNSHGNRVWHKLGEAGIAFLGETPEAETWLDYAVNKFHSCYPVWADDDGGWHEGVSYWGGYMSKAVWWLQVSQSALQLDGFKKPFFAQVMDYPLYVAPPGSPNMGFGDLSFRPVGSGWGGFIEYFLRAGGHRPEANHAGYWRWWMEQWKMSGEGGVLGFLYDANLPALPAAKPPTDLPSSKVFHGIGVASLHTTLLTSADDVHLLFKSSPFGSQSHGHNPQNTFQLNAFGEPLIVACTYRDLHGSKFHYQWVHSTVAQNGVLVNGEGQTRHSATATGRIIAEELTPHYDYVLGDAVAAYDGRLTRALRHAVLAKDGAPFVVLCDDLAAPEPAEFQFLLHALKPFTVDEAGAKLHVELPKASLDGAWLSPVPLGFRQWDGFSPPPDKEFPNQWHLQAGTTEKRKEIALLTVLVPTRAGVLRAWKAERIESETAVGLRLREGATTRVVAFRKAGVTDRASVGGVAFDGPVGVK